MNKFDFSGTANLSSAGISDNHTFTFNDMYRRFSVELKRSHNENILQYNGKYEALTVILHIDRTYENVFLQKANGIKLSEDEIIKGILSPFEALMLRHFKDILMYENGSEIIPIAKISPALNLFNIWAKWEVIDISDKTYSTATTFIIENPLIVLEKPHKQNPILDVFDQEIYKNDDIILTKSKNTLSCFTVSGYNRWGDLIMVAGDSLNIIFKHERQNTRRVPYILKLTK